MRDKNESTYKDIDTENLYPKTVIDNFDLFRQEFLDLDFVNEKTETPTCFIHVIIIKRKKDNVDKSVPSKRCIAQFVLTSSSELSRKRQEIIDICRRNNARAYITPYYKSFKDVNDLMLKHLVENVIGDNREYNPLKQLYKIIGIVKSKAKRFLIDVDDEDTKKQILQYFEVNDISIVKDVKTKSCCHLIVEPFNIHKFKQAFPDVDAQKNPFRTLLYMEYVD